MATQFLDEEEAADHADPRAGAAARPLRPGAPARCLRLRRLGQDDARGRAGKAPRGEGRGGALRLLQPRACRITCASARRARASSSGTSTRSARSWPARPGSSSRATRRTRRRRSTGTRSCPLALIEAIEKLGPQYDALFVDEAQDLENDWLDALMSTLEDPRRGPRLAVHRRQPARLRGAARRPGEFRPFDLTVNCRNTQAIAPRGPSRSTRARSSRGRWARRAARSSC